MTEESRKRRAGGRAGNRTRRGRELIAQMPWRLPRNLDRPVEPLDEAGVQAIHDGAMRILEEIGVEFLNDEALDLFRQAGCIVQDTNVRMGRDWVMEMIAKAPSSFTITPRNPERQITIGEDHILFGNVSSPPNYFDLSIGKKVSGTREQCRDLLRLTQYFNCVHFAGGYPVEPVDIHPAVRHLDVVFDKLTLTDKAMHAYSLGKERVEDVMEMVKIAGGLSEDQFRSRPHMYTNINSTSPLKHDQPMIDGCLRCVRRGQAVVVSPFTLAGAMAPVTLAGALVQQNAEALAGLVISQTTKPGAPFVYGGFTSNVDMKSGAPAFGTPEAMRTALIGGQLARRYGLPYRSSNVNAANTLDAQAAYETVFSLWGAVMGGVNMLKHGLGWMEGGLHTSFEKFVMDADILQMVSEFLTPVEVNRDSLALDAMREVGPGGHFFGCAHTQERYRTAFYPPMVSDWRNYESWEEAGSPTACDRTETLYRQILESYEAPPMDASVAEELQAFVTRRTEAGGAPTDF